MAVIEFNYKSEILNRSTQLMIALPENKVIINNKLSVLYLLHGLGDDHTKWLRRTELEKFIKSIPLVVVMPNFDKSFYNDMFIGDAYWTHLNEEIIPLINSLFSVERDIENNFLAGSSMGGFGAIKMFSNSVNKFRDIYSYSGIPYIKDLFNNKKNYKELDAFYNDKAFDNIYNAVFGNDVYVDYSQNNFEELIPSNFSNSDTKLHLYCGKEDPLLNMNIKFHEFLKNNNIDHYFNIADGAHDWDYWNRCLEATIIDISKNIFNT